MQMVHIMDIQVYLLVLQVVQLVVVHLIAIAGILVMEEQVINKTHRIPMQTLVNILLL